jgi:hypothetical protein
VAAVLRRLAAGNARKSEYNSSSSASDQEFFMHSAPISAATTDQRGAQWVRLLLALNLIAFVAIYLSGQWDLAEHAKGAVDRFWYPPHFGIYFGLLVAALIPLAGLTILLRTPGLPFDKIRANPALLLVIVANGLSFTGAPFDAWWHTTFGLDLTVWSPPHLHLLISTVLAVLGCAVYFLDDAPASAPLRPFPAVDRRLAVLIFTLVMALLIAAMLFVEYEGGIQSRYVRARPLWSYPVVWSFFALFALALSASLSRLLGMATAVALLYLLVRVAVNLFDRAVLDFRGFQSYPLLLPALVFDLVLAYASAYRSDRRWLVVGLAGLAASLLLALTTPLFWSWLAISPALNVQPWAAYWPIALGSGMLGTAVGWCLGLALRRLRPAVQADRAAAFEQQALAR